MYKTITGGKGNIYQDARLKFISSSVFKDRGFPVLERIVKYMKDELNLTYHEIALLLSRNDRTIWTSYNRAKDKDVKKVIGENDVLIPISVFQDRTISVLETMVRYMKEELNLRYHEIALLLNRNDRTIWTVYSRAKKKANIK